MRDGYKVRDGHLVRQARIARRNSIEDLLLGIGQVAAAIAAIVLLVWLF